MLGSDMMKAVCSWGESLQKAHDEISHDCWAIRHRKAYFGERLAKDMPCSHLSSQSRGFMASLPLQTPKKCPITG
jgi:hypothetical protein